MIRVNVPRPDGSERLMTYEGVDPEYPNHIVISDHKSYHYVHKDKVIGYPTYSDVDTRPQAYRLAKIRRIQRKAMYYYERRSNSTEYLHKKIYFDISRIHAYTDVMRRMHRRFLRLCRAETVFIRENF